MAIIAFVISRKKGTPIMKKVYLPVGVTLALLPLAALLPGCSGGGGGGFNSSPTSTPSPTATPTQSAPLTAPVNFGNGQTGTLTLRTQGTNVTGTLAVNSAVATAAGRSAQAFTFSIPADTYSVSGTFTPPRGFSVTGNFPAPLNGFSISGTIPTTSETGSYTINAGGQTVTGTYPKIGGPIPTSTPIGTPLPTSTPIGVGGSFNLTVANGAGSNYGLTKFQANTASGTKAVSGAAQTILIAGVANVGTTSARSISITLSKPSAIQVNDTFSLIVDPFKPYASVSTGGLIGGQGGTWGVLGGISGTASGSIKVTALSSSQVSVSLTNVKLPADPGAAKGTITLNGTATAKLTN